MISHSITTNDFLLLGDGKDIWLICGCVAYHMKQPMINDVSMGCNRDIIDLDPMGGRRFSVPGFTSYESTINIRSNEIAIIETGNPQLISELLFKRYSIQDLFKIINQKVEKRDQK